MLIVGCSLFLFLGRCQLLFAATNEANVPDVSTPPAVTGLNARELYNVGTLQLRVGKLDDAEMLLQSSLARQDDQVQPAALFNLGYVRFAQGSEELKKSPSAEAALQQSRAATAAGTDAIQNAGNALAGNDVRQMVQAYFAGHGVHKEMRAAMTALQRAMESYGKTLVKWQHALSDFQSAAELNPADTNAQRNAALTEQAIAKLVDSLRQMQQSAAALGPKQKQLGALLKKLKGQVPAPDMPPGAPGGDGDEDVGGQQPKPESLSGQTEADNSGGGAEMGLNISPETAGQLLGNLQPDGKLLPMGNTGDTSQPKNHSGRIW